MSGMVFYWGFPRAPQTYFNIFPSSIGEKVKKKNEIFGVVYYLKIDTLKENNCDYCRVRAECY